MTVISKKSFFLMPKHAKHILSLVINSKLWKQSFKQFNIPSWWRTEDNIQISRSRNNLCLILVSKDGGGRKIIYNANIWRRRSIVGLQNQNKLKIN